METELATFERFAIAAFDGGPVRFEFYAAGEVLIVLLPPDRAGKLQSYLHGRMGTGKPVVRLDVLAILGDS